ncbi:type VII secretion integral membrane protein EccD [Streptomyces sp. NPDC090080]|uniref:type VII secretion integral membrane protein EccD n=1 Tax=Streptomyces sp. NPDC090080 TaxID=3365939 RepID=UPI003820E5DC
MQLVENERCHVTVVGTRRQVDLAVPTDAAIAEYTPALLTLVGQAEIDDTFPPVWSLALPGAPPFAPEASLRECGVVDGATLYLRDAALGEFDEPVVVDLEESVEQADGEATAWEWRLRAHATLVLSVSSLVFGFVVLAWTEPGFSATGAGAMVAAFALALLAWHATRQRWSLPLGVRLFTAYAAVPLLAVAAASLPVAMQSTGAMLTALSAGAVFGSIAGLLAIRHATTLMAVAITGLTLLLTVCLTLGDATMVEAAAVVAVTVTAVLGGAPKISGHFAVLAGTPGMNTEAYGDEADVLHLVRRGQRLLVGTNMLGSLVVAASLVVLGTADQAFAVALAGCLGVALVLRAGRLTMAASVLPMVVAGTAGLVATLVRAPGNFGAPHWTGPVALLGVSVLALGFGLSRAFHSEAARERPAWIDPVSTLLLVVGVPLAVGVFGVYASFMNAGQAP